MALVQAAHAGDTRFGLSVLVLGEKPANLKEDLDLFSRELKIRSHVDPPNPGWTSVNPDNLFEASPFLWVILGARAGVPEQLPGDLRRFISIGGTVVVEGSGLEAPGTLNQLRRRVFDQDGEADRVAPDDLITRTFYILKPESSRRVRSLHRSGRVVWMESRSSVLQGLDLSRADRENRIRLGVNLVLCALTGSYKDDLTHIKYLMRRRK